MKGNEPVLRTTQVPNPLGLSHLFHPKALIEVGDAESKDRVPLLDLCPVVLAKGVHIEDLVAVHGADVIVESRIRRVESVKILKVTGLKSAPSRRIRLHHVPFGVMAQTQQVTDLVKGDVLYGR